MLHGACSQIQLLTIQDKTRQEIQHNTFRLYLVTSLRLRCCATWQVPNMSPTAASASSDLYCTAVQEACTQLRARLQPFRKDGKSWQEAVNAAYMARTDLSAHGFHATPDITGLSWAPILKTTQVNAAYMARTDLSAHGFHATPDITGLSWAPILKEAVLLAVARTPKIPYPLPGAKLYVYSHIRCAMWGGMC